MTTLTKGTCPASQAFSRAQSCAQLAHVLAERGDAIAARLWARRARQHALAALAALVGGK